MDTIKKRLKEILANYTPLACEDETLNLHLPPYRFDDVTMAAFFLDIEKEYDINLDELFDEVSFFSIAAISDGLAKLTSVRL